MAAPASSSLSGRVAVVTGATSGIGREVAFGLARLGATTVIVGRGPDRASRTAAEIAQSTGNPQVESLRVDDLAAMSDVRELAAALLDRFPSIHILVNNAGAFFRRRGLTRDGLERTFALNVLSPFLLTSLLSPRLIASAPARVVNVASEAHRRSAVDFGDLQSEGRYRGFTVYGSSKLELIWLTREFGRRFGGTGVTVNAVHPGFVRSGFALNNGGGTAVGMRVLATLFGRSVRKGADPVLYLATSPDVERTTGTYFARRVPRSGTRQSQDPVRARQLFEACERLTTRTSSGPSDSHPQPLNGPGGPSAPASY